VERGETHTKVVLIAKLTVLFHISSKPKIMCMTLINREQAVAKCLMCQADSLKGWQEDISSLERAGQQTASI